MNSIQLPDIITVVFCVAILVFFIYVFHGLNNQRKAFVNISKAFDDGTIIEKETITTTKEASFLYDENTRLKRSKSLETIEKYNWDILEEYKKKFLDNYAEYVSISQMIALFPLVGILGTVAGLISSGNTTNIEQIASGLGLAMWTTFSGLIASIILKSYDAKRTGKEVNILEGQFSIAEEAFRMETIRKELKKARTGNDNTLEH